MKIWVYNVGDVGLLAATAERLTFVLVPSHDQAANLRATTEMSGASHHPLAMPGLNRAMHSRLRLRGVREP